MPQETTKPQGRNGNFANNKGKSNPRKKGNFVKKVVVKVAEKIVPVYLYLSACHGATGVKKPLLRESSVKPNDRTTYGEGHLGVFRCSVCKKESTFSRTANKEKEAFAI